MYPLPVSFCLPPLTLFYSALWFFSFSFILKHKGRLDEKRIQGGSKHPHPLSSFWLTDRVLSCCLSPGCLHLEGSLLLLMLFCCCSARDGNIKRRVCTVLTVNVVCGVYGVFSAAVQRHLLLKHLKRANSCGWSMRMCPHILQVM